VTIPVFLIQQDVEVVDEFRQHDGVATVTVKLFRQGFAEALRKYDGGSKRWRGAPHTAIDQVNCVLEGAPPLRI